ncbi:MULTISPECIES: DUF5966 family protein [Streptococcus]|uniref:DUF5966 family protein n=7 Tax=root TaxID=1 RepID=A0A0P0N9X9_STRAP|nr:MULTISPECIES: DUF5966 family protein [Streptococcus]ETI84743.1 MAG: hypothetical protein Q615_SPAC00123G0019 [Streptococcus anginosus DORA_7]KAB0645514.1 hypothetical protein F6I01_11025 [Aerococcus sanguinicola]HEN0857509.1 hypothetical protein [Streptococcus agalactiae]ALL03292.1 hypothetical protein SanJ4211_1205c [Streptococcus anginosus]KAA9228798.1 hypothetical protein F6I38_06760 [Streptococcus anginosus]
MMEQILQSSLLITALGLIFIVLFQIVKAATGLVLIGLIGSLAFMEIFGIYLFFTERNLYTEDLATNGIWSFTGFYIASNFLFFLTLMIRLWRKRVA